MWSPLVIFACLVFRTPRRKLKSKDISKAAGKSGRVAYKAKSKDKQCMRQAVSWLLSGKVSIFRKVLIVAQLRVSCFKGSVDWSEETGIKGGWWDYKKNRYGGTLGLRESEENDRISNSMLEIAPWKTSGKIKTTRKVQFDKHLLKEGTFLT